MTSVQRHLDPRPLAVYTDKRSVRGYNAECYKRTTDRTHRMETHDDRNQDAYRFRLICYFLGMTAGMYCSGGYRRIFTFLFKFRPTGTQYLQ